MNGRKLKAVINGVVGDYLEASNNELSIKASFYLKGKPVDLLQLNKTKCSTKICILVHGLTDDESTWNYDGGDYGQFLAQDMELSPFYFRYNTGLHISTNGKKLAKIMNDLDHHYPTDIEEISFVCHSLGGLVTRSALHTAMKERSSWIENVARVVFLGTPHHGSPWEKLGNVLSSALDAVPRPYMKLAASVANLRSSGIKDLRYGYITDEDWQGEDPDGFLTNNKKRTELFDWISYHIITGTITSDPNHPLALCVGDGLVRKDSGQGSSDDVKHHLNISPENCVELAGISHCGLSHHPSVYSHIRQFLQKPRKRPRVSKVPEFDAARAASTLLDSKSIDNSVAIETEVGNSRNVPNEERSDSGQHDSFDPVENRTTMDEGPSSSTSSRECDDWCRIQNWADAKGTVTLVRDAVGSGVSAVEHVHLALTKETFAIVAMVKPIARGVKGVEGVHDTIVGGIYSLIRMFNTGTNEAAQYTIGQLEKRQKRQTNKDSYKNESR